MPASRVATPPTTHAIKLSAALVTFNHGGTGAKAALNLMVKGNDLTETASRKQSGR
jgi:hypothetical protein